MWSECLQLLVLCVGLAAAVAAGSEATGGLGAVWAAASASGRLRAADWDPSPFVSATTWSVFFGGVVWWGFVFGCGQTQVQRASATATLAMARG